MNQRGKREKREDEMTLSIPGFGSMNVSMRDRTDRSSITPPIRIEHEEYDI